MKIDDCLFEPCGYSMNAISCQTVATGGVGDYATIHITGAEVQLRQLRDQHSHRELHGLGLPGARHF